MQKHRHTSIRLEKDVEDYINRAEGTNFSVKFHNLIRFCMTREKYLYELEKEYQKRIRAAKIKLKTYEELIEELEALQKQMDKAIKVLEKVN